MKHDMNGPADTRMMGIVHTALRRDLARLHDAHTDGRPGPEQRAALGAHAAWMMEFLHAQHAGEGFRKRAKARWGSSVAAAR